MTDTSADRRCGGGWGGCEGTAARGVGERGAETADEVGDALGIVMDGHVGRAHGGMSGTSRSKTEGRENIEKVLRALVGKVSRCSLA